MKDDGFNFDDEDGVTYEPSEEAKSMSENKTGKRNNLRNNGISKRELNKTPSSHRPTKRPPQKSQYAIFYIVTIFAGIIICIIIFAIVFNSTMANNNKASNVVIATDAPIETSSAIQDINQITGVIKNLDQSSKQIQLLDTISAKTYTLFVDTTTILKNEYGQEIIFAEFSNGNVVDANFDKLSNKLVSLSNNPQTWKHRLVKNLIIDTTINKITLGNDIYSYTDDITVVLNGNPYDISKIDPVDVVSISGFNSTAWYIEVNKGHGTLQINNFDDIKDGSVEIDTSIFVPLSHEDTTLSTDGIKILEGSHRIVVKGSNIEPFIKDFDIKADELVNLDLKEVQPKTGVLNVNISEKDAKFYIDDVATDITEPLLLPFGEYTLKAEKLGFVSWEDKVIINQNSQILNVTLDKEVVLSKITIASDPSGADIYIDTVNIGQSPVQTSMPYGTYTITVKKDGYLTVNIPLNVTDKEHKLLYTLQKAPTTDTTPIVTENTIENDVIEEETPSTIDFVEPTTVPFDENIDETTGETPQDETTDEEFELNF